MKKKILYLDMDGVVADFEKGIVDLAPELADFRNYPDQAELSTKIDQTCYANPDMYHNLPPMYGAVEAVTDLPVILMFSSCQRPCGRCQNPLQEKDSGSKNILGIWGKRN